MHIIEESRLSSVVPKDDPINGCGIHYGELLAYLNPHSGEWVLDYCEGWRRHTWEDHQPVYVRFKSNESILGQIDVPLKAVRRPRDERDDKIDQLKNQLTGVSDGSST